MTISRAGAESSCGTACWPRMRYGVCASPDYDQRVEAWLPTPT
ncbi:hypothetical protein [Pseudonocardia hierapolitana]|nr:hypothetical protein [Pseudonocardia hierapolitana]